jgi:hypothetical protein
MSRGRRTSKDLVASPRASDAHGGLGVTLPCWGLQAIGLGLSGVAVLAPLCYPRSWRGDPGLRHRVPS